MSTEELSPLNIVKLIFFQVLSSTQIYKKLSSNLISPFSPSAFVGVDFSVNKIVLSELTVFYKIF